MTDQTPKKSVGIVVESLPNTEFKVELEDGKVILCYMSGKMKMNRIRVLLGDKVEFEVNPYEGKSRLTRRL